MKTHRHFCKHIKPGAGLKLGPISRGIINTIEKTTCKTCLKDEINLSLYQSNGPALALKAKERLSKIRLAETLKSIRGFAVKLDRELKRRQP